MNWLWKAWAQKALSTAPGGEALNYFLQRRVFRELPVSEIRFAHKARLAVEHFDRCRRWGRLEDPAVAQWFEFGVGWDLIFPLMYWSLGATGQTLIDVRPLARLELVNNAIQRISARREEWEKNYQRSLRDPGGQALRSLDEMQGRFAIRYIAPGDAARTDLPDDSVDCITSNSVLEHIPREALGPILRECRRILKSDGVISCLIDLQDHSSFWDPRVTIYNFLRFTENQWRRTQSPMQFQNRLRGPDYLQLIADAGFEIRFQELYGPTSADLALLRAMDLAPEFRRYPLEDLGIRLMRLALRKTRIEEPGADQERRP